MSDPLTIVLWALSPAVAIVVVVLIALLIFVIVAAFSGGRP